MTHNNAIKTEIDWNGGKNDICWYSPKLPPFTVHGLCTEDTSLPLHRMPPAVASKVSERVNALHWDTAGGRIRFATDSPYIAVYLRYNRDTIHPIVNLSGQAGMDLYEIDGGKYRYVAPLAPRNELPEVFTAIAESATTDVRTYSINLPAYQGVTDLYIGLAEGANVLAAAPYKHSKPVLYYGSSITQGAYASRPGNTYPALLERYLDTDYINLGFSGGACGETAMAEHLASLGASVFVCDYDYNADTSEELGATHLEMYRIYRRSNPTTPIVFMSRPDPMNNPVTVSRQEVIKRTVSIAKSEGDDNVYFVNGALALQGDWSDSCTFDGVHPTDLGFYRMAEALKDLLACLLN